jgi:hypothetical protein
MKKSDWNGYLRVDFIIDEHECILVCPKENYIGNPWVWRAEFFGAFDSADIFLLNKGWHIAYYSISNMYGNPKAIDLMKNFHNIMISEYNLCEKADIFGFSRGGLYAVNYIAKYPNDVCTLYLDAPVLDIRSWPGGLGKTKEYKEEWMECKLIYELYSHEDVMKFKGNPLDKVDILIKNKIPIIMVAGDSDDVVDFYENGAILEREYLKKNCNIKTILKPGIGHHPHSLENPDVIVEFIINNYNEYIQCRNTNKL